MHPAPATVFMPNIILMGATFDTGNMGVSALACSLVKLFSNMDPEARIGFFVGAQSPSSQPVRLAEQKELLLEVFRGLTGSPASLQGSRDKAQPASAASM